MARLLDGLKTCPADLRRHRGHAGRKSTRRVPPRPLSGGRLARVREAFRTRRDGPQDLEGASPPGHGGVFPGAQEILTGATVVVTLGTPIVALAVPCRIVSVIDGQTRWGFAYGTLPGHPEQGEEAFSRVHGAGPDRPVRDRGVFPSRRSTCPAVWANRQEAFKRAALRATSVPSSDSSMRTLTSPSRRDSGAVRYDWASPRNRGSMPPP